MRFTVIAAALMMSACQRSAAPAGNETANADGPAIAGAPSDRSEGQANTVDIPAARISRFTKLDDRSCVKPTTNAETGDWSRRCTGVEPYDLEWSSGDLREDLAVISGAGKASLHFPTIVARGAFDSIAPAIEWRGPPNSAPDRLIARVRVANDQGEDDGGHLVVVRLHPTPCIIGIVPPSAAQNDRARAIADAGDPACQTD